MMGITRASASGTGRQVWLSRFYLIPMPYCEPKGAKVNAMQPSYLIHFNNSSFKNDLFRELFGDEEQFLNQVFDRVISGLENQFELQSYPCDEGISLVSSNRFEIKMIKERLYINEIKEILIRNRSDILILNAQASSRNLSELASASNVRLITVPLPSYTNYEFFNTQSIITNRSNNNNHNYENLKEIFKKIFIQSAIEIIIQIIKNIIFS